MTKVKSNTPIASIGLRLISWIIVTLIWGSLGLGLITLYFAHDLPDIEKLSIGNRTAGIVLETPEGKAFSSSGDMVGDVVLLKDLPPYVPQAVVAIEDRRFYSHWGVDPVGMLRAAWANYKAGGVVQGGSTLTQQLAKNFLLAEKLYDTYDRSFKRKIQEVILAFWLEHKFTKDQILTLYLNRVYLGSGVFGVDGAARKYYGRSSRSLSLYEAAVIAGLLKAPSKYAPTNDPILADTRAQVVLKRMEEEGYITPKDRAQAKRVKDSNLGFKAPYFADWIYSTPTLKEFKGQDIIIQTTIDMRLQEIAEWATSKILDEVGEKHNISQISLVAMDQNGAIKALVGGRSYGASKFNRATQAVRQPGSTFKYFLYLTALENGYTEDTLIEDTPLRIGKWSPKNYHWKPRGEITLRQSLAHSVNTVSARLIHQLGPQKVKLMARRLGISTTLPDDLTLALGSGAVTLLELTAAYDALLNQGYKVIPHGFSKIIDQKSGRTLYETPLDSEQVLSSESVASMRSMLQDVLHYGSGKSANIGNGAAGKSGTSQKHRDAWFVGTLPGLNLTIGIWVGNDDESPMKKVTGGSVPAKVWRTFAEGAQKSSFRPSPSILPSTQDPIAALMDQSLEAPEEEPEEDSTDDMEALLSEIENNTY